MSTTTTADATTADRTRQVVVLLGAILAIAGAAWGSGAFGGTPIAEAADGALAADATLLAPASGAFGIWSVIYLGLAAFAVVQALPSRAADPRMRAVAWPLLVSMVLNAVWIATVQAELLWLSVIVIAVLVATLARVVVTLIAHRPSRVADAIVTDITTGLYLGWASVATAANVTAWGADALGASPDDGTWVAAAVLVVVAVIAAAFARAARTAPWVAIPAGLAMAWGLGWIAYGRAEGDPHDLVVMWAAGIAACVAFAAPFLMRDLTRPRSGDSRD
ncbi:tryptophan-rich sensory protein [Demequina sp. NBRC 110053]|uniref:tryptophan-rich sensory protein n=1 Tax=Demequina sp. NBRC 110053 TaxID=1570342 RepID=UPI0009FE37F1|nr:tryptophan-rich sensory protein [Demequina sp. NBRC 110053]